MDSTAPRITRSDERQRWELDLDGTVVAFAEFVEHDGALTIPYIETVPAHRGNGHSAALMDGVATDLRARGLTVRATCPVARAHLAERAPDVLVR